MPKTLLLEIGAEELPSSFVDAALAAMPALAKTKLDALRLGHGAIRALGTVSLMGRTHPVEVDGSLKKADAAALARLGLAGAVLIAEADFSLVIKETALAPDAGSFKGDRFPIHVSLVLRHTGDR